MIVQPHFSEDDVCGVDSTSQKGYLWMVEMLQEQRGQIVQHWRYSLYS